MIEFDKANWQHTYLLPFCIAAVMATAMTWFSHSYKLILVLNSDKCLPGSVFVVDTQQKKVNSGELVMFKSPQTDILPAGINIIKLVAGVEGDRVDIGRFSVTNKNHKFPAPIDSAANALNIDVQKLIGTRTVENGGIFVLGTEPGSYDSRFFGSIKTQQVIGRAYLII
ncbi:S26 family signal peptidase [Shewanella oncorhynchi]|uniref:S26 family signal peptidase n=1 Tax=Shewanella TaxID=22 RepID=UPI0039AF4C92